MFPTIEYCAYCVLRLHKLNNLLPCFTSIISKLILRIVMSILFTSNV